MESRELQMGRSLLENHGNCHLNLKVCTGYNPTVLLLEMTKDRPNRVQDDQYIRKFLVALFVRVTKYKQLHALESG